MSINTPTGSGPAPSPWRQPDLIVLSHLRWNWVWQRPQHLISRLAAQRQTWFVEGPVRADVSTPTLRHADAGPVRRVWLEIPADSPADGPTDLTFVDFAVPGAACYAAQLVELLGDAASGSDVWLYGPTALPIADALRPRLLMYDMMDDLSSFADGTAAIADMQRQALKRADIVFTGGRSLYRTASAIRGTTDTHLFPSGVETGHYARSRDLARSRPQGRRPVAGYVGVLDERLDLTLIAELAARLPDWDIHLVGPVTKIKQSDLPQAPNLVYPGMQTYDRLPHVMAEFDVALMPFALNDATRSISPTKTLEYLAAGLPVVSTRVPDVVADWDEVVRFADDGAQFAESCRAVRDDCTEERDARVAPLARRHEWDAIAAEMAALANAALVVRSGEDAVRSVDGGAPTARTVGTAAPSPRSSANVALAATAGASA